MPRFDVVCGNPPYQSQEKKQKLWPKFVQLGVDILKPNGIMGMITPNSWLAGSANIKRGKTGVFKDVFSKYKLKYTNLENCKKHFPDVGVSISYFILEKIIANEFDTTWRVEELEYKFDIRDYDFLPPNMNFTQLSINKKMFSSELKFESYRLSSGGVKRKLGVDEPDEIKNIKTYVRGSNLYKVNFAYFDMIVNPKVQNMNKVIIPMSGAEKFMPYVDFEKVPICLECYIIELSEDATYEGCISYFNSKLMRFMFEKNRSSGFIQIYVVKNIPEIDFTRSWTDAEIYDHFKLTKAEIKYIENSVK